MQMAEKYKYNGGIDYVDDVLGPFTGRAKTAWLYIGLGRFQVFFINWVLRYIRVIV